MAKADNITKEHVAAAKKWLGKAEMSLNNQNNIRGDIHIMLAEAELKRAKEKNKRIFILSVKQWGIILPVIICVLAGAFFFMTEKKEQNKNTILKAAPALITTTSTVDEAERAISPDALPQTKNRVVVKRYIKEIPVTDNNEKAADEKSRYVQKKQAKINSDMKPAVPSREMQQLMRTAKKTLQE